MTEQQLARMAKRRLAILRHAEEITGNVALPAATTASAASVICPASALSRSLTSAQGALPSNVRQRRSQRVRSDGVMIPTTSPSSATSTRPASPSSSLAIT